MVCLQTRTLLRSHHPISIKTLPARAALVAWNAVPKTLSMGPGVKTCELY